MSQSLLTLHVDDRRRTRLRSKIFGHDGVIIQFREGIIAKKCRILQELNFYRSYVEDLKDKIIPSDLVPEIEGIVDSEEEDISKRPEVSLCMKRDISCQNFSKSPYLMMHDIADGYELPAVLDVKLGTRTWALGASRTKRERMMCKCQNATTGTLSFRVRAAMWYSKNDGRWPAEDNINYVCREWGNTCTQAELEEFFTDFFHYPNMIPGIINKLRALRKTIATMRNNCHARMFSSSVLFAYDERNPEQYDCRLLDFAKCYLGIEDIAAEYNESVEECEDSLLPAISNLIDLLRTVSERSTK